MSQRPGDKDKGNALFLVSGAEMRAIVEECMDKIDNSTKKLEKWAKEAASSDTKSTQDAEQLDMTLKTMTEVYSQMKTLTEKTKENVKAEKDQKKR